MVIAVIIIIMTVPQEEIYGKRRNGKNRPGRPLQALAALAALVMTIGRAGENVAHRKG